jgi:XTP/dITP diphosphohydrolase
MELVFATNNLNKLAEVQNLIPKEIQLLSLENIGCNIDIPETQNTIEGNAIQKAEYIQQYYGYNCFADDTGLEVDALKGEPGVYSARYAGPQRNASDNMSLLLKNLKGQEERTARFKTVIALSLDNNIHKFTGLCHGRITLKARGTQGFGYDPIFQPEGYEQTFAEMDLNLKNQIGHRGKAVLQLVTFLNELIK